MSPPAIALFGGRGDRLWPSCATAKIAFDKLTEQGHAAAEGDVFECFEGAGHGFTTVGLPTTSTGYSARPSGEILARSVRYGEPTRPRDDLTRTARRRAVRTRA